MDCERFSLVDNLLQAATNLETAAHSEALILRIVFETKGGLEGQRRTAIRGRPIDGPSGLGQTVGHAPNDRHS